MMVIDLLGADEVEQSDQTHLQGVCVCVGGLSGSALHPGAIQIGVNRSRGWSRPATGKTKRSQTSTATPLWFVVSGSEER